MRLLYYANGARYKANGEWVFRKWVEVPSQRLLKDTGLPRKAMYRFRDELAKANYVRYKAGDGTKGTEYHLCLLNEAQKAESKPTEAYRSLPNRKHPHKGLLERKISLMRPFGQASETTSRGCAILTTPPWSETATPRGQKRPPPIRSLPFLLY